MKVFPHLLALNGLALLLAACGGGGGGSSPEAPLRPANTSCIAPALSMSGGGPITLVTAFPALPAIERMVGLYQAPGDNDTWYALSQNGSVFQFDNRRVANGYRTFLNLERETFSASNEAGLLGLAFHPQYATNGWVYLYYMPSADTARLSRFRVDGTTDRVDKSSEKIVLELDQPALNHNGGGLGFGPDGYLYLALGDGGGANDPFANGQNPNTLLGALLRLDVDVAGDSAPYEIPSDNPFVDGGGRPEVFAYGLRNPWRWSFDRATGELWLGDVGQNEREEIDRIVAGGNYGWPIMEGTSCLDGNACDSTGLRLPVADYSHSTTGGCSVTGGYVYRSGSAGALNGHYLFGDFCNGIIYGLDPAAPSTVKPLLDTSLALSAFAEDQNGELYAISLTGDAGSNIYRIEADDSGSSGTVAAKLSDTGCFSDTATQTVASGVVGYTVNSPLWSDGASKQRYFGIPDDSRISFNAAGEFIFPDRSVLIKNFSHRGQIVETRLFMKHLDGWAGYSYQWNRDKTDAELLDRHAETVLDANYTHIFPSPGECMQCHTAVAGFSLGAETLQLNTGDSENALEQLYQRSYLDQPVPAALMQVRLFGLKDDNASLEQRARSYLHSNCSNCHRPGGPIAGIDLRFQTPFADTGLCNTVPLYGNLGQSGARLVAPGDATRSVLSLRMQALDSRRMPPIASKQVDTAAVDIINDWINGLAACD